MIYALSNIDKEKLYQYKILIAGSIRSIKYYNEINSLLIKLGLKEKFIFLGIVSKKELKQLYTECEFLIFPSPCENFAYTLVEAMSCGAAITCSNTTAMPETCGEAAIYFDPYNIREMSEKIELLIDDNRLLKWLRHKSLERATELPYYKEVTMKTYKLLSQEI